MKISHRSPSPMLTASRIRFSVFAAFGARGTARRFGAAAVLSAVTALALGSVAAQADTLSDIKKAGVIEIATDMQYPPFDMLKGQEYEGFDHDLIEQVAKELGVKAHVINLPWTSILPGLEAKKFDITIAPVVKNKARASRYAFTAPISEATPALLKRADNTSLNKPTDIAGKNIGAMKASSVLEQLHTYVDANKLQSNIAEYVTATQGFADVANGRLDAFSTTLAMVNYAVSQRPTTFKAVLPAYAPPSYFCWVGRLGSNDDSLIKAVDQALWKIQADGRLAAIQKKWFGAATTLPKVAPEPTT